jgi:hypothetical protein
MGLRVFQTRAASNSTDVCLSVFESSLCLILCAKRQGPSSFRELTACIAADAHVCTVRNTREGCAMVAQCRIRALHATTTARCPASRCCAGNAEEARTHPGIAARPPGGRALGCISRVRGGSTGQKFVYTSRPVAKGG